MELLNEQPNTRDPFRDGYTFHVRRYIKEGFDLVQRNLSGFIGLTIIWIVLSIGIGKIGLPYAVQVLFSMLVQPVLMAGYFFMADKIRYENNTSAGNMFLGFKVNYLHIILASFVGGIIAMIPLILAVIISLGFSMDFIRAMMQAETNPLPVADYLKQMAGALAIASLFTLYLALTLSLRVLFVIFKGYNFGSALAASFRIVNKRFFKFLLFMLAIIGINFLGLLCLGFGLLFTIPASMCAFYAAFDDIIGSRDVVRGMDISEHLISGEREL
jgi:hypothetical protein